MAHVVGPSFSRSNDGGNRSLALRAFFASFSQIVRQYGLKGVVLLLVAAMFAFAPLTLLYWFNEFRLASQVTVAFSGPVVVKPARFEQDQEQDEPGKTALLQVICETASGNQRRSLLLFDDPRRDRDGLPGMPYVRHEQAYVRPAGRTFLPFLLLGRPPVSAWLPAGDYEILVVHEAPRAEPRIDASSHAFPLISVFAECSLENQRKTVCRVALPHYDGGGAVPLELVDGGGSSDRPPRSDELGALVAACENVVALPTPAGYVLSLAEPAVQHDADHRRCTIDFADLRAVPREWTRDQLATVRNWLPADATAARARFSSLVDALGWREFLAGWFCYAAAGISGLVFTRWGALAMLEPWRRGDSLRESLGLIVRVFLLSVAAWFVWQMVA